MIVKYCFITNWGEKNLTAMAPGRKEKRKGESGLCASLMLNIRFYQIFTRALSGLNILSPSFTP